MERQRSRYRKPVGWGGVLVLLAVLVWLMLTHPSKELARMERIDRGDYAAILWEGREYVPWGAFTGSPGEQIGYVDGDEKDKVFAYAGQSPEQWLINAHEHDGAMLYREVNVPERPEGLEKSEYAWNP